jgi:O-antigen ligase
MPPQGTGLALLGVLGAPAAWAFWRRPELGLLAMCFFTASFLPRTAFGVNLAGFRLDAADLTLLGLLVLLIAHGLRRGTLVVPGWLVVGPLLAFAAVACFSALYARIYEHVPLGLALGELRPAAYCAGCALIAATITRRPQVTTLLLGLFILADLTAGAVILQQFVGPEGRVLPGMAVTGVWQIDALDAGSAAGPVRIVPPGHVLVYVMANVAFCLLLGSQRRWWRPLVLLQLGFLSVALLLTFTRGQWVASGIAALLACVAGAYVSRAVRRRLKRLSLAVVPSLALAGLALTSLALSGLELAPVGDTDLGAAVGDRVGSMLDPDETLASSSLRWRAFEAEEVFKVLSERPLLGVGLGNDYRLVTLLDGEASGWQWDPEGDGRLTRFVHNSYLYIAVKMGLLALALWIWFCLAFIACGARTFAGAPEGTPQLTVLAVSCSFVGLLEWATFEAHLMNTASMATVGLMVGVVAAGGAWWPGRRPALGGRAHG